MKLKCFLILLIYNIYFGYYTYIIYIYSLWLYTVVSNVKLYLQELKKINWS